MKHLILIICLFTVCSCVEKYPTNLTNDLPFGLEYNMSKSKVSSVIDSLSKAGAVIISPTDSNVFYYDFLYDGDEEVSLSVTLQFHGDSLYKVDVRSLGSPLGKKDKEEYEKAICFFKSQGIALTSYKREKDEFSNKYEYDYEKYPYQITLYSSHGMIIIFSNQQIEQLAEEQYKESLKLIKMSGNEFCKSIMDISTGIYKAAITDAGFLVIGVRPIGEPNFDYFAKSYLEQAIDAGVHVKGCFVVDINKSTWENGAVIGDRIGKAYK